MISPSEVYGNGFTMIVDDQELQELNQPQIDQMFDEISDILTRYGLSISIVASQEDAMKFQGKIYLKQILDHLEKEALT